MRYFLLPALVALSVPVVAQEARITYDPAKKEVAERNYWDCLNTNAARFDDGVSEASTVAKAIQRLCQKAMRDLVDVIGENENERRRMALLRAKEEQMEAEAIVAVLAHRIPED